MPLPHHTSIGGVYRVAQMWGIIQHVYLCWRDFPDLRFGQFIMNAVRCNHDAAFNVEDRDMEMSCYRFWIENSGRATKRQQAKWQEYKA